MIDNSLIGAAYHRQEDHSTVSEARSSVPVEPTGKVLPTGMKREKAFLKVVLHTFNANLLVLGFKPTVVLSNIRRFAKRLRNHLRLPYVPVWP